MEQQDRTTRRGRLRLVAVVGAVVGLVLSGCGQAGGGTAAGGAHPTFGPKRAAAVLADFDHADSTASSAGDIESLRTQETTPALDASIAAVHRAEANGHKQPAFHHVSPRFAVRSGTPTCFLASATLQLAGEELGHNDFSQFVRSSGGDWKLSNNVPLGSGAAPQLAGLGSSPATPSSQAIPARRRHALAREIFARTTGGTAGDRSIVADSTLLDRQLGAGWGTYSKSLAHGGARADRALDRTEWSACSARVSSGATAAFLTLWATDTVTPTDGHDSVTLPAGSRDLISVGRTKAATGSRIAVRRVETFLLLVPPGGHSAVTVLGLVDNATAVHVTR